MEIINYYYQMNTNRYGLIEKNDIGLLLRKAKLYSKLCQFRVQNINFLHPIFALCRNPKQSMLLKITRMKIPEIWTKIGVFGVFLSNLLAFQANG